MYVDIVYTESNQLVEIMLGFVSFIHALNIFSLRISSSALVESRKKHMTSFEENMMKDWCHFGPSTFSFVKMLWQLCSNPSL